MKKTIIFSLIVLLSIGIFYSLLKSIYNKEARDIYKEALMELEKGNFIKAEEKMSSVLKFPFVSKKLKTSAHLFLGWRLYKRENYKKAKRHYDKVKLEKEFFKIRYHFYFWKAELLKKLNNLDEAEQLYKLVYSEENPYKLEAGWKMVKIALQKGKCSIFSTVNFDELYDYTKKFNLTTEEEPISAEFLYNRAICQLNEDKEQAFNLLLKVWKEYPYSIWGRKAAEKLKENGRGYLLHYPSMSLQELLKISHLLYQRGRRFYDRKRRKINLEKSIAVAEEVLRHSKDKKIIAKANLFIGRAFYRMPADSWRERRFYRRKSEYHLKAALKGDPDTKTEAYYYLIRLAYSQSLAKVKYYANVVISHPSWMYTDFWEEAIYFAGYPFFKRKQYKNAIPFYKAVIRKKKENDYLFNAYWRLHWCYYHLRQWDKALEVLYKIIENFGEKNFGYRLYAKYWIGRIYEKMGKRELAISEYRWIASNARNTYYGRLSLRRLKKMLPSFKLSSPAKEFIAYSIQGNPFMNNKEISEKYYFLNQLGLYEWAAREMEAFMERNNITKEKNYELWRSYAGELWRLYNQEGAFLKAWIYFASVYKDYLSNGAKNPPDWFYNMLFPIRYKEIIYRYGKKYNLDLNFLAAFVREESYFDPLAKSPRHAIGLLQLMPATAKYILDRMKKTGEWEGKEYSDEELIEKLYDPEFNFKLGVYYIKEQKDRITKYLKCEKRKTCPGLIPMLIAAYNAGPGRVRRWLRDIRWEDEEELIDQIDITETRVYVKKVMKYYFLYKEERQK